MPKFEVGDLVRFRDGTYRQTITSLIGDRGTLAGGIGFFLRDVEHIPHSDWKCGDWARLDPDEGGNKYGDWKDWLQDPTYAGLIVIRKLSTIALEPSIHPKNNTPVTGGWFHKRFVLVNPMTWWNHNAQDFQHNWDRWLAEGRRYENAEIEGHETHPKEGNEMSYMEIPEDENPVRTEELSEETPDDPLAQSQFSYDESPHKEPWTTQFPGLRPGMLVGDKVTGDGPFLLVTYPYKEQDSPLGMEAIGIYMGPRQVQGFVNRALWGATFAAALEPWAPEQPAPEQPAGGISKATYILLAGCAVAFVCLFGLYWMW